MSELPTDAGKVTNVLIVDDHPSVRRGIRQILEHHPLISIVGEADTAQIAVQLVTSGLDVDVVLMDVKLPDFSGIEATKRIKARRPNVKIIILSAFGSEFLAAAINAGADGYLLKSTSEFELASTVRRAATGAITIDPTLASALFDNNFDLGRLDSSSDLHDPINREDGGRGDLPA